MVRFIYTLLLCLLMPAIVLRLLWRSFSNPAYRERFLERFSFIPKPKESIKVWIHAVSVGETMAAKPLIDQLIQRYGDQTIMVSSTTITGSDTVQRLFADHIIHHYFPYDLPMVVDHYLKQIQPDVFVCMETEIWPNLWQCCHKMNIPVVLANARLSTRSTHRYQKFQGFTSAVLNHATLIACRNQQDADNFKLIGADAQRLKVLGDIKSDIQVSDEARKTGESFKEQWGNARLVLVAASTHEGEDSQILDLYTALNAVIDNLLLVVVPRHPERFAGVDKLINDRGFVTQRRSSDEPFSKQVEVILGDSMGEMMAWFVAADLVFMGGSLVPTGGHNPLEPLACGKPVISGSHVFNFKETFKLLVEQEAAFIAQDIDGLSQIASSLLLDDKLRKQAGDKGQAIVNQNKGATSRLVEAITALTTRIKD